MFIQAISNYLSPRKLLESDGFHNRHKQCQQQFGLIFQGALFWSRQ